jgi:hypothetical protein
VGVKPKCLTHRQNFRLRRPVIRRFSLTAHARP